MQIECNRRTADDLRGLAGQWNVLTAAIVESHETYARHSIVVVMLMSTGLGTMFVVMTWLVQTLASLMVTSFVTVMMSAARGNFAAVARDPAAINADCAVRPQANKYSAAARKDGSYRQQQE